MGILNPSSKHLSAAARFALEHLTDSDILALTVWGEARGEIITGQIAVANVIRNRWLRAHLGAETIADVCLWPSQFSCWQPKNGKANYEAVHQAARALVTGKKFPPGLQAALDLAMWSPHFLDYSKGSMHYHTRAVRPSWSRNKTPVVIIGAHYFYNDID